MVKVRKRMGISVRTMVEVTAETWERGGRQGVADRVVTSTRMGSSVRMMVKLKATRDGDQHEDMVKMTTEVWERGGRRRE